MVDDHDILHTPARSDVQCGQLLEDKLRLGCDGAEDHRFAFLQHELLSRIDARVDACNWWLVSGSVIRRDVFAT